MSFDCDPVCNADSAHGWLGGVDQVASRRRTGYGGTATVHGFQGRRPRGVLSELFPFLIHDQFRGANSVAKLAGENVLGLVSRSLFLEEA